jgi:hypothetical protein
LYERVIHVITVIHGGSDNDFVDGICGVHKCQMISTNVSTNVSTSRLGPPAHAEHTGHASVTFLRAISEYEETQSFILALAIISGARCLATVSEAGHRFILPGLGSGIRKAEREF